MIDLHPQFYNHSCMIAVCVMQSGNVLYRRQLARRHKLHGRMSAMHAHAQIGVGAKRGWVD